MKNWKTTEINPRSTIEICPYFWVCIQNYKLHLVAKCPSLQLKDRLRNSDGWSGVWGRLFRTKSVMGRLWDDHFRDLGYPPKFYRVRDAGFIGGPSIWWQIIIIIIIIIMILKKHHRKIIKIHVCFIKVSLHTKTTAGKLATEVRIGDAPKPLFSIKSVGK